MTVGTWGQDDQQTRVVDPPTESTGVDAVFSLVVIQTTIPTLLGRTIPVELSPVSIGRDNTSVISIEEDAISRRHASLVHRHNQWHLADHGSTNGTRLNGKQIKGERALTSGDKIKVGQTVFKFICGEDAEAKYYEKIYRLSVTDPLTATYNKRFLFQGLDREVSRAQRHSRPLSLIMLDIDHFKTINDSHGHPAGDEILKTLAGLIAQRLRSHDILARYGGEEFVVVLPETELDGTVVVAESLRELIDSHPFTHAGKLIPVSISLGCACATREDSSASLIQRADTQLYRAKRAGRNRVCS